MTQLSTTSFTQDYTTNQIKEIDPYGDVAAFFMGLQDELCLYDLNFHNFDYHSYARENLVWLCRRRGKPVGVLFARLYPCVWDWDNKTLWQDGLFCKKSSGKAAYLLLKQFVDFGRQNANLIFTCKTKSTNVKESSFQRLGFKKTEELYLLGG